MKTEYTVLGGMAGSSMDGLDLALVNFHFMNGKWNYQLIKSETIAYPRKLHSELQGAPFEALNEQKEIDIAFGHWVSDQILAFIGSSRPELLSIHGHTLIHSPKEKISWQLGNGQTIANRCDIRTITNFRSKDIELGGQGAPLVPVGDFELYQEYDACLNLGGIANISIKANKSAGDICPCNQVLNYFATKLGYAYDDGGILARKGDLDTDFIELLEQFPYYHLDFPKSLPNQAIPQSLLDTVEPMTGLRTYSEFIANQIARSLQIEMPNDAHILATGGGVYNNFLMSLIQQKVASYKLVIPPAEIISFKEAIIFAFLGLLRLHHEVNVLCSVTGAVANSSSGVIHLPK